MGFKFIYMKGYALFLEEKITKCRKYILYQNLKIFLSRITGPISTKLGTKTSLGEGDSTLKRKGPYNSQKRDCVFFSLNQHYGIIISCANVFIYGDWMKNLPKLINAFLLQDFSFLADFLCGIKAFYWHTLNSNTPLNTGHLLYVTAQHVSHWNTCGSIKERQCKTVFNIK